MENGVFLEDNQSVKMGASSNPNAARLTTLQERKKALEESLVKRNQELRQLCIQEAELTGVVPAEIPLEPGESPPTFRRRVGTAYQLPQNLINNLSTDEESMSTLELALQVQAHQAEAALGLANETNVNKTVRRQYMAQYQQHKHQYRLLEEKLTFLKTRAKVSPQPQSPSQPPKQRKKPRPVEQDDTLSMNINIQQNDTFVKSALRHSMRSLQHPYIDGSNEQLKYSIGHQKLMHRNSDTTDSSKSFNRTEETIVSGIYRLSLNGYKNYMERKENANTYLPANFIHSQSNPNLYPQKNHHLQYSQIPSHTLPSPRLQNSLQQPVHSFPNLSYPHSQQSLLYEYGKYSPISQSEFLYEYSKYSPVNNRNHISNQMHRQSNSPIINNNSINHQKSPYCSPTLIHAQASNRQLNTQDQGFRNPHQIQPHQLYEQNVMTAGLGGYWKQSETGELVWCNSKPNAETWQRDKRFGSLDRRKNKRLHKRISPSVDPKSATISTVTAYTDVRPITIRTQPTVNRNRQDNRQLVRTQSLGSVGAQTVDSVWPSDDNSSCGSDAHSMNEVNTVARKQKQKEWFETSLDEPASPTLPSTRSQSAMPATVPSTSISPEEKYVEILPQMLPSPTKPPLEIPAESSHSNQQVPNTNVKLFNSIPKNCTLIQAGQCKPYYEESKPFEMSDFYKYSTKFKKSPVKQDNDNNRERPLNQLYSPRNLNQTFEDDNASVIQKGVYQPLQPMKCQPFSPNKSVETVVGSPISVNTSLDLSQLTSNVAENFSVEMNAWYKSHETKIDNNNTTGHTSDGISSTATLV